MKKFFQKIKPMYKPQKHDIVKILLNAKETHLK